MNQSKVTDLVEFKTVPVQIDYWCGNSERALINIVPEDFKELMLENREPLGYLLTLDEGDLRMKVRPQHDTNHLRLRFWSEYDTAQKTNCPMDMRHIIDGITTDEGFYMQVSTLGKLAWILKPPKDYMEDIQEALSSAMHGIREILDAEIRNDDGSYNTSVMNAKLKAFGLLDNRAKGLPTQTILKKSLSVNVHQSSKSLPKNAHDVEYTEEELITQELMDIQQDIAKLTIDPRVLHVNED